MEAEVETVEWNVQSVHENKKYGQESWATLVCER